MESLLRIIGIVMLFFGFYNIYILLLFRKKENRTSTVAKLTRVKTQRNVRVRKTGSRYNTKKVPYVSTGFYFYSVDGKEYRLTGHQFTAPGQLPQMPRVTYLVRHPRHAYLEGDMMYLPEIILAMLWLMGGLCVILMSNFV